MTPREFYENYFSINLKDYPNIGVDLEISKIMFFFLVGLIAASFALNYFRGTMHSVIKALTRYSCFGEENAKTLSEINLDTKGVRYSLKDGSQLSRIVGRTGKKNYSYEEYLELSKDKNFKEEDIDFSTSRFFIIDEEKIRAEKILTAYSPSILRTAIFSTFMVALYMCLLFTMPDILSVVNNILS